MIVTAGVKSGIRKQTCDDTAIVNATVINDDYYECQTDDVSIVGLADGVGGNAGGKTASMFVAQQLSKMVFHEEAEEVKKQILHINDDLIEYSAAITDQKQMATTLSAIVFSEGKAFLIHIGNTRMYVAQGSFLKQLTTDHTTYQWLLSHGQIEAAETCNKNEIFSCMGGGSTNLAQKIEVTRVFEEGLPKCIVLSSDGIHEYIQIDRFEELLFSGKPDREIITEVIEEAEKNGSEDDKSLIIVRKQAM